MKFCQYCGAKLGDEASFCSSCGSNLNGSAKQSPTTSQKSDPSLTKNIILISVYVLLTLISFIPASLIELRSWGPFIMTLCISALLAFFGIRPSDDHVDTLKMNLLKTIECFGVSAFYFIASFFVDTAPSLVYQIFALIFASWVACKIRKIHIDHRTVIEKVILAFAAIVIAISCLAVPSIISQLINT